MEVGCISENDQTLNKLFNAIPLCDMLSIIDAISKEADEFALDKRSRSIVSKALKVSTDNAQNWATVADIIKHFDLSRLCEKHPEAAKSTAVTVLSVVGLCCPATSIAAGLVKVVPTDTLSKLLGVTLKASPDHLINLLVDDIKTRKQALLTEYEKDEITVDGKTNLVIVCKDDLLFQQINKLVSAKDDTDESNVIGTKDGTVRIIRWGEDKWIHKYNKNTVNDKVVVIGKVKGFDRVLSTAEVKFSEYGVSYGWAGNVAVITADIAAVRDKKVYAEFLSKLEEMEVPDIIKKDFKFRINLKFSLIAALATPFLAKDFYDDTVSVARQLYFYGVMKLYYNDLEEFMQ